MALQRRTRLARLQYSRDDSVCHAASHGFVRCVPAAHCAHARGGACGDTSEIRDAQHRSAGPKAMLSPDPAKRPAPTWRLLADSPLAAPARAASDGPPSGDFGFPKRESPFRQLLDERGELRRCPFVHMHEDVVLRFVRLLEELVLDIRILFRTRALRRQGVP